MNQNDYPSLYQASDKFSSNAQSQYLLLVRLQLGLLVAGSIAALLRGTSHGFALAAAILFFGGVSVSAILQIRRPDRDWYLGRAAAESIKTITWRFMMQAEPYRTADTIEQPRKQFLNDLRAILNQNQRLAQHFGGDYIKLEPVTQKMVEVRTLELTERLSFYQKHRIEDQRDWYAKRSKANLRHSAGWFWSVVVLQALAGTTALLDIAVPSSAWPIDALVVSATAVITWTQVKRFNDLATAYSLAAHEIVILKEMSGRVSNNEELSDFVKDAENAFSREHTQWVARRDT